MSLLAKHEQDLPTFFEQLDDAGEDWSSEALVRAILERWLDYVRENRHAWVMLFRDSSGDEEIRARRRQVSIRARQVMGAFIAGQPGSGIPAQQIEPTAELLTSGLAGLALLVDRPPRRSQAGGARGRSPHERAGDRRLELSAAVRSRAGCPSAAERGHARRFGPAARTPRATGPAPIATQVSGDSAR